jgi:hypothetical protein
MAYLYRHIRLDKNEPFYIGIGSDAQYKRANSNNNRTKHWKNIISKTAYRVDIVFDDLTWEEACEKEKEFISIYKRKCDGGILCNITLGGEGVYGLKHSEEAKQLMSIQRKGRVQSEEAINKRSEKLKGINNPNYGKQIPDYQKEIIASAQRGRTKSDLEKEAIYSKTRKKVLDMTSNKIYDSIKDAAKAFNICETTMSRWTKNSKNNFKLLCNY